MQLFTENGCLGDDGPEVTTLVSWLFNSY